MAQISVLGLFGSILATVALGGFALPLGLVITAWDIAYAYRFKQRLKPGMENHLETQWAKRNGRAKEDIEPVLIEAIALGLLTEIGSGEYRVEALRRFEAP